MGNGRKYNTIMLTCSVCLCSIMYHCHISQWRVWATNFYVLYLSCLIFSSLQTLKRVLHSLSCGKHKVLKRIAAAVPAVEGAVAGEKEKEKEKGQGGLIKITDSFIFNASFRYTQVKTRRSP